MATAFEEAAREHSKRLARLIDRGGVERLRKLYEQAQAELERKLARLVDSSDFTVHQRNVLLAQIRIGQMDIAKRLGDASSVATIETQLDALNTAIRNIKRAEKKHGSGEAIHLPIEESARFQGLIDKRKSSLLKQHTASMKRYGSHVVKKIEGELSMSLMTGESGHEAVARVARAANVEFWRAERIVRTEQAFVYSATQRDAIAETARDMDGELYMRWTELVADGSLEPLDERVGADSVALHGQVVLPGEMFRMPSNAQSIVIETRWGTSRVSDDMMDGEWEHPPNRPHDRATIMPWHPDWEGPPSWRIIGGEKVHVTAKRGRGLLR